MLRHFATRFGTMPVMRTTGIGYGMGKKDFPIANCVRVILGDTEEASDPSTVLSISCNVDDMTAEEISFAMERLFDGGAREVFTTPVTMKKSRPGTLLTVICLESDRSEILRLLFRHTTTIGVREQVMNRYILNRRIETIDTPYGPVRRKISEGYGVCRTKWEYEDLAGIAAKTGRSLEEIRKELSSESK